MISREPPALSGIQSSVFECDLDNAQYRTFQHQLSALIDPEWDSLRFYSLGNHYADKITHIGTKPTYDPEDVLML